jgi:putative endonuclease
MADLHNTGQTGEELATAYLKTKGYTIRKRNWRSGKHEIDIIAENKDFIVFLEVKTRSEDFLEHPVNAVTRDKQRSIILAADNFIRWNNIDKESRFDVVTVIMKESSHDIDHIENAFYPTLR